MNPLTAMLRGARSLLTGMGVTLRALVRRPVTEVYPHTEPELPPAYRGAIKLIRFEETDSHDCVACLQCEKICPSFCIAIEGEKVEGIKKQRATKFTMDFALCSLCGLCIDVCPTTTLEYSRGYDAAGYQRDWTHDLLAPFREGEERFREEQRVREAAEAAAKAAAKAAAVKGDPAEAAAKAAARAAAAKGDPAEAAAKAAAKAAAAKGDPAEAAAKAAAKAVAVKGDPAEAAAKAAARKAARAAAAGAAGDAAPPEPVDEPPTGGQDAAHAPGGDEPAPDAT